jgi:hypothetical protein
MALPVDEHISRTGIEVVPLADIARRQHGDIRDASDVLHGSVQGRMSCAETIPGNV